MKICFSCGARFSASGWECPVCGAVPAKNGNFLAFNTQKLEKLEGYDPEFYRELASLEARNFWFSSRNRLINWVFKRYFPSAKDFFEIGCGTGFTLSGIQKDFPSMALSGCDIFSKGLDYAQKRVKRAEFYQMDACRLYFKEEFDVVGAFDILEHVVDDETALFEMNRVLRKRGGVLLSVPQHPALWSKADEAACHVRRYGSLELKKKVERSGFRILDIIPFVSILLPLMMASRLSSSCLRKKYSLAGELKLHPLINAALENIANVEFSLICAGIRFPFGSSLLLAAHKI
jgi:ubiquinone/menaquinone biosynthesis C-methylase UbiE